MIAEEAYVLSKSFTNNSIKGITGALAGKNCTIKSTTKADGVTTVVFAWTADDGTEKTTTIQVNDGAKGEIGDKGDIGIGIDNVTINANSHLIVTLSDGSTIDAGLIQGGSGTDDYEDLINRPKIEGVDLIGNKTFEDLGVASATDLAQTNGHLQDKVDKTDIATELSDASTDDEVVGALTAYNELHKLESANKEQFATARGEAISVNNSVDGKIRDLKLYGKSEQKQYSGKNLLNSTLETTEKNGVTCTANGDGTYTLNGMMTGSGFTEFMLCRFSYENGKMYKICGCPDNGNWGKYGIISSNSDSIIGVDAHDYGNGSVFTPKQSGTLEIQIRIWAGVNADKLTFKPMLVDATLYPDTTYDDFEPYTGGIPSPNPNYPQEIKSVVEPVVNVTNKDETESQSVTLTGITLNAIPVSSGGNVTIDGQEYISDYVDFENKKLVRRVKKKDLGEFDWNYVYNVNPKLKYFDTTILDSFKPTASHPIGEGFCDSYSVEKNNIPQSDLANNKVAIGWLNLSSTRCCLEIRDDNYTSALDFKNAVKGRYIYYPLATQETIDLTDEEVQAFRELATYYPTTNVFVSSDQLDGYAELKYPTTDVSGLVSRNESRIVDIEGTVGSTDISDIGDGTITNAISMMSSKLGGLTFSASGTTLTITNGTNTWTLEANS